MKPFFTRIITLALAVLFASVTSVFPQDGILSKPRSEKLLNDLPVYIWSQAESDTVTVRLRIHRGAAYDPVDKAGTFALLGDILFPEEEIRDYFREDLGGDLTVEVTYDYVEVTATARSEEFLTVLETLAPALINTEITKETTEKLIASRLEKLEVEEPGGRSAVVKAASKRLYGSFPYGRPVEGTKESLANIDFGDLIYVRERFLTADNATLTIKGNVRSDYAYLAARRLLGSWNKSGSNIPATFKLPESPETETLNIYTEGEVAYRAAAVAEGYKRSDASYYAAEIFSKILAARMKKRLEAVTDASAKVVHHGFLIRGVFELTSEDLSTAATVPGNESAVAARRLFKEILNDPVSSIEMESAKASYFAEFSRQGPDELRMDIDTFQLADPADELARIRDLKLSEVQSVRNALISKEPVEVVIISRPPVSIDVPEDPKDPS
ncbi:MAG: insulinase family protein [Acidobacteria bacterium]|nr:MAG: insulinase family protein [Acidobacteriota bacterium]REK01632.1 MAG: insulinase family protein [Acidobacteriota bacterium]REK14588.1 MAG: insulinase family protein [Acidobacteriota bacterium]REK45303.1 MAG: insulinase family protein [Acidobacteriota bacterium]